MALAVVSHSVQNSSPANSEANRLRQKMQLFNPLVCSLLLHVMIMELCGAHELSIYLSFGQGSSLL